MSGNPITFATVSDLPPVAKRLYQFSSPSDATKFLLLCYCLIDSEKMILRTRTTKILLTPNAEKCHV